MVLTFVEEALQFLLQHCRPVAGSVIPVERAIGSVAAEMVRIQKPVPETSIALRDGFAVFSLDTVGASPYTPVFGFSPPQRISCGDSLSPSSDAVLPAHAVRDDSIPIEILHQAIPGENVRREGDDLEPGYAILEIGDTINPLHLGLLRAAAIAEIKICRPHLLFITRHNLPRGDLTGASLARHAKAAGCSASVISVDFNDPAALRQTIRQDGTDMLIFIGGTGEGKDDHLPEALRHQSACLIHGLALRPGETGGCGFIETQVGPLPMLLAPGRLEAGLAVWLALGRPCLASLSRSSRQPLSETLPLLRKITSNPGIAEIVLLRRVMAGNTILWDPLACGDIPWHAIARAEAFHIVPSSSEGYAAGDNLRAEFL